MPAAAPAEARPRRVPPAAAAAGNRRAATCGSGAPAPRTRARARGARAPAAGNPTGLAGSGRNPKGSWAGPGAIMADGGGPWTAAAASPSLLDQVHAVEDRAARSDHQLCLLDNGARGERARATGRLRGPLVVAVA